MIQHSPNCNYITRKRLSRMGIIGCCGMVGLIGLALLYPVYHPNVNAEETGEASIATYSTQPSSVSISLTEAVNINITPTIAGTFGVDTTELSISTNNTSKYSIFLRTKDGENTLTNAKSDMVNAVSANTLPTNFPANTWGYALGQGINTDSALYNPVPINADKAILEVGDLTGAERKDDYTLAFGVKMDTNLPSGEYGNDMILSVIAEPLPEPNTLEKLTYMQDMTTEICNNTPTPNKSTTDVPSKQLIDSRDGKIYWVSKLADGKCWMTQNLAYGGAVGSHTDGNHGSVGNYYIWSLANSICPENWRLPNHSEHLTLINGLSIGALRAAPYYFVLAGYDYDRSTVGNSGFLWSSTLNGTSNAYALYFTSSSMNSSYYRDLSNGFSVRCIAQ